MSKMTNNWEFQRLVKKIEEAPKTYHAYLVVAQEVEGVMDKLSWKQLKTLTEMVVEHLKEVE